MANQLTGRIAKIDATKEIMSQKSGQIFRKREMILDCTRFDSFTGQRLFENYPTFEFVQDKCNLLDSFQVGQIVTVSFDVQGNKVVDKVSGETRFFNSVRGYKIELLDNHSQKKDVRPQPQQRPAPNSLDTYSNEVPSPFDTPF